jgi:hypothetical protein
MPPRTHPFDALAQQFAKAIAERIAAIIPNSRARGPSKLRGRKLDMRCRYPGCKNRSKGPRFRFLCADHLKLPKKKQLEVLAKRAAHA